MKLRLVPHALLVLLMLLAVTRPAGAQSSATIVTRLTALETKVATLSTQVAALQSDNESKAAQITDLQNKLASVQSLQSSQAAAISVLQSGLAQETAQRIAGDNAATQDAHQYADTKSGASLSQAESYSDGQLAPVKDKVVHFSRNGNEVYITGANVHILNGTGYTFQSTNGLGNLIIGYNELRGDSNDNRTGSHNLVLGFGNNYTSFGGIINGGHNTSGGYFSSIIGGTGNTSSGHYSVVVGGYNNTASGSWSTIGGGLNKTASGQLDDLP